MNRQTTYKHWKNFAINNNLIPVYNNLEPDANPWCFPAYTKNHMESIKWFEWGWKHNIEIFSWPSLPKEEIYKNGNSIDRWKKIICFGLG